MEILPNGMVYRPCWLVTNAVCRAHMLGLFKPKEGRTPQLASWHKLYLEQHLSAAHPNKIGSQLIRSLFYCIHQDLV